MKAVVVHLEKYFSHFLQHLKMLQTGATANDYLVNRVFYQLLHLIIE